MAGIQLLYFMIAQKATVLGIKRSLAEFKHACKQGLAKPRTDRTIGFYKPPSYSKDLNVPLVGLEALSILTVSSGVHWWTATGAKGCHSSGNEHVVMFISRLITLFRLKPNVVCLLLMVQLFAESGLNSLTLYLNGYIDCAI